MAQISAVKRIGEPEPPANFWREGKAQGLQDVVGRENGDCKDEQYRRPVGLDRIWDHEVG